MSQSSYSTIRFEVLFYVIMDEYHEISVSRTVMNERNAPFAWSQIFNIFLSKKIGAYYGIGLLLSMMSRILDSSASGDNLLNTYNILCCETAPWVY